MSDRGHLRDVEDVHTRVGDGLAVDDARVGANGFAEVLGVVRLDKGNVDAEPLQRSRELRVCAAVKGGGRNHVIARLHEAGEGEKLSGLSTARGERGNAAFEGGHALLEDSRRRIHDSRVDVTELPKPEESGGVLGVLEYERGRLIDRDGAGSGGRVG